MHYQRNVRTSNHNCICCTMVNAPDEREVVHELQRTHGDDAYFEADNRIELRNLFYPEKIIYQIQII